MVKKLWCCSSFFWKYINSWYCCKIIGWFLYQSDESYEQESYAELDAAQTQLCTEALNRHQKEENIIIFKDKYFWYCIDTGWADNWCSNNGLTLLLERRHN